jgi:hypothetical protein
VEQLALRLDVSNTGSPSDWNDAPALPMRSIRSSNSMALGWTRVAVPVIAAVFALANMTEFTREAANSFEVTLGCVMGALVPAVAHAVMYDR